MNKPLTIGLVSCSLFASVCGFAHDEKPMAMAPGSPDFVQLKQLAGKWEGTSSPMEPGGKPGTVTTEFRVTSGGSAVEEDLMKGTPHEMIDMYADEGGKLTMTHYCSMGNHPHMVAKSGNPKEITLETVPSAGMDSNSLHMHSLTLSSPDADHLTERWVNFVNGKPGQHVDFNLTRSK